MHCMQYTIASSALSHLREICPPIATHNPGALLQLITCGGMGFNIIVHTPCASFIIRAASFSRKILKSCGWLSLISIIQQASGFGRYIQLYQKVYFSLLTLRSRTLGIRVDKILNS